MENPHLYMHLMGMENLSLIESLLSSAQIDVNNKDKEGNTPLNIIQKSRKKLNSSLFDTSTENTFLLESAKLLIEKNDCDLNIKNQQGKSVISQAIHDLEDDELINLVLDRAEQDLPSNQVKVAAAQNLQHKNNIESLLVNRTGTYFGLLPLDILGILKAANIIPNSRPQIDFTDSLGFLTENPEGYCYGGKTTLSVMASVTHRAKSFSREQYKERIKKIIEERKA